MFVKGRESFDDFDGTGQVVLVITSVATVVLAALGLWFALRAAYGQPRGVSTEEIQKAGGVAAWNARRASDSANDLRGAQRYSVLSLVALVAAIGATWLADEPAPEPPASVQVEVAGEDDPVCGELRRFDGRRLKIKVDSEHSPTYAAADVESLEVVASCDDEEAG
jgi:hypothetical protein